MNTDEAIEFLSKNQPMADDKDLDQETISTYNLVRTYFLTNYDERCVRLFLNSFGQGSGFGIYQLVEDVIEKYDKKIVVPQLIEALKSKHKSVKYWSGQIAASFPDKRLLEPLKSLLNSDDFELMSASAMALAMIDDKSIIEIFQKKLKDVEDKELKDLIKDILNDLQKGK